MCDGAWKPTKRLLKNAELVVLPSVFQKNISGYITHVNYLNGAYLIILNVDIYFFID